MHWIEEHYEKALATVITIAGILGVSKKQVRTWLRGLITDKKLTERGEAILELVKTSQSTLVRLETRFEDLQDEVTVLISRDDHRFRFHNFPAFECTLDGCNLRVSNAYLDLLGLQRADDINSLDWAQFIEADDIHNYFEAFSLAASKLADFGATARFKTKAREPRGKWFITASLHGEKVYFGKFIPDDDLAREIVEKYAWKIPT